jgi:hypothetical protein
VVEWMNELSIMVERVALPCVLAVRCTTWMNFVYSSCHQGVACEDHVWFEDRWMVASLCDE